MQRPKLTFIHGFMGDPSDWNDIRACFKDYEICTPLIRPAADWNDSIQQLADELPERSVIVGYSMGARLALGIALTRPELCDGLMFVSGNPGLRTEQQRQSRYAHDCKIADRIESEPRIEFLKYWYTAAVFETLSQEVRTDEIHRKSQRSGDDWAAILRANSVAMQPDYWPRLDEVAVPALGIAGMADRKYANMMTQIETDPGIDGWETRVLPNCGHIVHRERPDVFCGLVRDFLMTRVEIGQTNSQSAN